MILLDEFSQESNALMAAFASRQDEWLYWQMKESLFVEYFYQPAPLEKWTEKIDAKITVEVATPTKTVGQMGRSQVKVPIKDLSAFTLCANLLKEAKQVSLPFEDIKSGQLDDDAFKRQSDSVILHFQKIRNLVEEMGSVKFEKMKKGRPVCGLEIVRTKNSKGFLLCEPKFRSLPELKLPRF